MGDVMNQVQEVKGVKLLAVSVDGVDYTDLPALKGYTDDPTHGFDAAKAGGYRRG